MDIDRLIASLDHTVLNPTATWGEVQTACREAVVFGAASVCIPACYVRDAADYLQGRLPISTVIGFPHGSSTTGAKLFEAKTAIMDGASEVEMVTNLGYVKDGRYDKVFSEVSGIKAMIGEDNILKVIVETCLLSEEEKVRMCVLCEQAGADYIRTSTGFSTGGATFQDVALLSNHKGLYLKIKASGGVRSLEDAAILLDLGATRIGSSNMIALLRDAGHTGKHAFI